MQNFQHKIEKNIVDSWSSVFKLPFQGQLEVITNFPLNFPEYFKIAEIRIFIWNLTSFERQQPGEWIL